MKRFVPILTSVTLLIAGCTEKIDYDIEDVAPAEHLRGEDEHLHTGEEIHDECCTDVHEETDELEGIHAGVHQHESGMRNHGTEWFFNQPWAASFVWGKMMRDTVILLLLATALFLIPLFRRRKQK